MSDFLLGLVLGSTDNGIGNRLALEGVSFGPGPDGARTIAIEKLEAASLRVVSGSLAVEVARLALHKLSAQVTFDTGRPRLHALEAAGAELAGVKVLGELHAMHAPGSWSLGPLASADGSIRARIPDAQFLFDADVTVPIRQGTVHFGDATVAHVGPDSRMGVSQLGLYVDAPNGRSYLYHFPGAPVAGVEYEKRDALLGPWVSDRGKLALQPFVEWLLSRTAGAPGVGFTEQARLLFERTTLAGEVRLGDGALAAPGVRAELAGSADGRNAVSVHSATVSSELTAEIASLSVRQAVAKLGATQLECTEVTGALMLRPFAEGTKWRFELNLGNATLSGLRVS